MVTRLIPRCFFEDDRLEARDLKGESLKLEYIMKDPCIHKCGRVFDAACYKDGEGCGKCSEPVEIHDKKYVIEHKALKIIIQAYLNNPRMETFARTHKAPLEEGYNEDKDKASLICLMNEGSKCPEENTFFDKKVYVYSCGDFYSTNNVHQRHDSCLACEEDFQEEAPIQVYHKVREAEYLSKIRSKVDTSNKSIKEIYEAYTHGECLLETEKESVKIILKKIEVDPLHLDSTEDLPLHKKRNILVRCFFSFLSLITCGRFRTEYAEK